MSQRATRANCSSTVSPCSRRVCQVLTSPLQDWLFPCWTQASWALRSSDCSRQKASSACRKQKTFQLSWKWRWQPYLGTRLALAVKRPRKESRCRRSTSCRERVAYSATPSGLPPKRLKLTVPLHLRGVPDSQAFSHELGTGASQGSAHQCVGGFIYRWVDPNIPAFFRVCRCTRA